MRSGCQGEEYRGSPLSGTIDGGRLDATGPDASDARCADTNRVYDLGFRVEQVLT